MRRSAPLALALLTLALPIAGCGGGKPLPVRNRTIGLKLDEYRIRPQEVSAPAGELRLIVRNRGVLTHNVAVETISDDPESKATVLGRTATVHPGDRAETRIFLRPGRYRLICTIANHSYLGQFGTLVVK
jgi:plastocyanin